MDISTTIYGVLRSCRQSACCFPASEFVREQLTVEFGVCFLSWTNCSGGQFAASRRQQVPRSRRGAASMSDRNRRAELNRLVFETSA